MSTAEIAAPLGISPAYISKWRTGYRPTRMNADLRRRLVEMVGRLEFLEQGPFKGAAAEKPPTRYESIDPKLLGQNLERVRLRVGLSQGELAKRAKLRSSTAIAQIESGKLRKTISHDLLVELASALKVHPQELIGSPPISGETNAEAYAAERLWEAARRMRSEADRLDEMGRDLARGHRAAPAAGASRETGASVTA